MLDVLKLLNAQQDRLRTTLTELDPLAPQFAETAWQAIAALAEPLWQPLRQMVDTERDVYVLQQAWAAGWKSRLHVALLYRAGMANPATREEALRLRGITLERWQKPLSPKDDVRQHDLVAFLMAADETEAGVPHLGRNAYYKGSIRLRYALAHAYRSGAALPALLHLASVQACVTAYQRRIEFSRVVQQGAIDGRMWRRLGATEYALLSLSAQELLVDAPATWPQVLLRPLNDGNFLQLAAQLTEERKRLNGLLSDLMHAIRMRHLGKADAILAQVPDTPLAHALSQRLKREPWGLDDAMTHPSMRPAFGPWVPMSKASLARLRPWAPQALPAWWGLSATEVAQAIGSGELVPQEPASAITKYITRQDLAPLQRTWTRDEQLTIIKAGAGNLLPMAAPAWDDVPLHELVPTLQAMRFGTHSILARRLAALPDASEWIALMADAPDADHARKLRELAQAAIDTCWSGNRISCWSEWVVSAWGCAGWDRVQQIALAHTTPLKAAVAMFASSRMVMSLDG
ncbi:MAG: hypothetical protein EBU07_11350, partial [Betaproteobacteria bacterium]|nr:hypothetical protein [Betaproteobacteria bacterium]